MMDTITQIRIDFAIPVELTDEEMQALSGFVQDVCDRHCPEGWVYWQSGAGSMPVFSQSDAFFLGKEIDPNAPESGEPTFDHEVFHLDTSAREAYPQEIERNERRRKDRERRFWWQAGAMISRLGLWIRRHA